MNRYQSIISFIVSLLMVLVVPRLQARGIILDESTVTTIVMYVVALGFFTWTAWRNHNITEAAQKSQMLLDSYKAIGSEVYEEDEEGDD